MKFEDFYNKKMRLSDGEFAPRRETFRKKTGEGKTKKNSPVRKKEDSVRKHITALVIATLGEVKKPYEKFLMLSTTLGIIASSMVFSTVGPLIAACSCFTAMGIPYLLLRSKLQLNRVKNSREGEVLVGELLANYKICYANITEAIEITAKTVSDAPMSKALLLDLAIGLNTATSKEDVNKLLNNLRFAIGTVWADMLATNLYFAITQGTNITRSLQDLLEGLIRSRHLVEYNKRGVNEAVLILKYLGPASMALTVFSAVYVFNFTIEKYLEYQFQTASGLSWFLMIIFSYIVGIAVSVCLGSKKLDL